jgi:GNAT superfamily N-acetyltransferase
MDAVRFTPVSAADWPDLADLFGPRGAAEGCWCAFWRCESRAGFRALAEAERRKRLKARVESGPAPGLIGRDDRQALVWIALGPRADFPALDRSRIAGPTTRAGAWAIACLHVRPGHRRQGLGRAAVAAAAAYARAQGAPALEAWPRAASRGDWESALYMGLPAQYQANGFRQVGTSPSGRGIWRLDF